MVFQRLFVFFLVGPSYPLKYVWPCTKQFKFYMKNKMLNYVWNINLHKIVVRTFSVVKNLLSSHSGKKITLGSHYIYIQNKFSFVLNELHSPRFSQILFPSHHTLISYYFVTFILFHKKKNSFHSITTDFFFIVRTKI